MTLRLVGFVVALGVSMVAVGQAWAKPPLGDVPEIRDGVIAAALAYEIGKTCDSLDARKVKGISFLMELKSKARDLGYSDDEIDQGVKALEGDARALLRDKGAVEGQPDTYCTVGNAEIASGSQIGNLLK
jgi:hypothetical protein